MNTERVVVITGAAGGIGALLAGCFLRNGDTVIATDVSDEALKALAERTGRHSELHTIAADIFAEPDTEQARKTFPAALLEAQRNARALRRDQKLEDLVGTVFFLASSDADFITGQAVNVDGGKFTP
jgi:NAD(P)-dependent dehydrogenase (short-subunit alcohol dehydrogenase family)